jgi:transcriptional regulator with XRE-family HTH domain
MSIRRQQPPAYRLINPEVVRRRRLTLGISEKQLGKYLNVSPSAIATLESGSDQRHYDIAFLVDLAAALEVPVTDLLETGGDTDERDGAATTSPLPSQVGSILAHADQPVPVEALCRIVSSDLTDTADAVDELARRLNGTGLTLRRFDGMLTIVPALDADPEAIRIATRTAIARGNLGTDRASLLLEILRGKKHLDTRFDDPWVGQQLINAGLVEITKKGTGSGPVVSEGVRYSLMRDTFAR